MTGLCHLEEVPDLEGVGVVVDMVVEGFALEVVDKFDLVFLDRFVEGFPLKVADKIVLVFLYRLAEGFELARVAGVAAGKVVRFGRAVLGLVAVVVVLDFD